MNFHEQFEHALECASFLILDVHANFIINEVNCVSK